MLLLLAGLAHAEPPDPAQLLAQADAQWRSTTSHAVLTVELVTERYERTLKLESWSEGQDKSRIVILAPEKDAGTTTLMVGDKAWTLLPRIGRAVRLPMGMMGGSWMGSHLSNDDLVRASTFAEDYTCRHTEPSKTAWHIRCDPNETAPVPWGRVEADVGYDQNVQALRYFEEGDTLSRTLTFSDYRRVNGTPVAFHMEVLPTDAPGEKTAITYELLELGLELDPGLFELPEKRGKNAAEPTP